MRNVVLIILDTVRYDTFCRYATQLQAASDIEANRCYASSSWSVPSHASMFTGELIERHGAHAYNRSMSDLNTFLSDLPHRTVGATANIYSSEAFGFDSHFDDLRSLSRSRRFGDGIDAQKVIMSEDPGMSRYVNFLRRSYKSRNVSKSLLNGLFLKMDDLISQLPIRKPYDDGTRQVFNQATTLTDDEPFFLFVNVMEAHAPLHPLRVYRNHLYDAPPNWTTGDYECFTDVFSDDPRDWIKTHRDLYNAAIDYLDRMTMDFINRLQAQTAIPTTFIVTADHGESLLYKDDRRLWSHPAFLTESLLNVPFVIINTPNNERIQNPISHLDLPDMIRALALKGQLDIPEREIVPAEVFGSGVGSESPPNVPDSLWSSLKRTAICHDKKVVWDSAGRIELVSISDDSERKSLNSLPEWASQPFKRSLEDIEESLSKTENTEVSAEVAERLQKLGYR